jgi:hypothetical protein
MVVSIHHQITDPKKWEEIVSKIGPMVEQGKMPKGLKPLFYLPSTDGHKADCVWEGGSLEEVKRFLEPLTSSAARNEYMQINADQAMGLPSATPEHAGHH